MTTLQLASDLQLPAEIAGQTVALVGIRGSGKTNTAGVIAEELLDRHQPIVVLDPTDAWWGLRSGYPVFIFGGPHGDIPLAETDGKVLAEFVVTEQVPLILSLRHLRKNAQRRFVTEFCEELYHLKGRDEYRSPLTVFIDEAPLFIPQRVIGEVARTVGAVEDLISRGRNSGFGVVLIGQRPATINKDVLSQADTIISHRLTSPQDRKALAEWIEENATIEEYKSVLSSLATLKTGMAWVWAPSVDIIRQVQIKKRKTFDSSAAPKAGQSVKPPKALAEIDLNKLKGKLAATIEKTKADDPKELRQEIQARNIRILQLEHVVKDLQVKKEPPTESIKEVPVLKDGQLQQLESLLKTGEGFVERITTALNELRDGVSKVGNNIPNKSTTLPPHDVTRLPPFQPWQSVKPLHLEHVTPSDQDLSKMARTMLIVLAQHPHGLTKGQILVHADYRSSGSVSSTFAELTSHGWVEMSAGQMFITEAGRQKLGKYERLPTGADLLNYLLNGQKLSTMEKALLRCIAESARSPITKGRVLEITGYASSGSTSSAFANLVACQYVRAAGRSELVLAEELRGS